MSEEDKTLHYSAGKLGLEQIPEEVLAEVAMVYSYGEVKYARDNWKKGTDWHEFYGSARRHMAKWWLGKIEDESGCHELAHAIWNLITLMYYEMYSLGNDDRPPPRHESIEYRLGSILGNARAFRESMSETQPVSAEDREKVVHLRRIPNEFPDPRL